MLITELQKIDLDCDCGLCTSQPSTREFENTDMVYDICHDEGGNVNIISLNNSDYVINLKWHFAKQCL